MKTYIGGVVVSVVLTACLPGAAIAAPSTYYTIEAVGTWATGIFDETAAEIPAYDPASKRLFVSNDAANGVDIIDVSDPANPTLLSTMDLSSYGSGPTSVAFKNGIGVVCVVADPKTDPGVVVFYDQDGSLVDVVPVGANPDMIIFTPDGTKLLVANEGEPNDDYSIDPEGSISIIDVAARTVVTADFTAFNPLKESVKAQGIRIYGPNASVAQDVEPEYIAVSADGTQAWVTLQENNALAVLDIPSVRITWLLPLGLKDHSLAINALDASDKDGAINITTWPVKGMYQPDGIVAFEAGGQTYLIMANEGDARDYDTFSEEVRVADVELQPSVFHPAVAAWLQESENLGRLRMTSVDGLATPMGDGLGKGNGKYAELHSFGARSFSIRDVMGGLVYDSGSELETVTAATVPASFNANNTSNSFDNRSDDKGPEPEAVTVGLVNGRQLAFVGLERVSGVVIYDVSNPVEPVLQDYVNNRNFSADPETELAAAGDLGPEGLLFIPGNESPMPGTPMLVVANEISGTTTLYQVVEKSFP